MIHDYPVELADAPAAVSPFIEGSGKRVGVRSIVNAACGSAGDVIAVLYVMSRTPNVFTERDMEILVAMRPALPISRFETAQRHKRRNIICW